MTANLVLSLFPGIGLLDMAFEEEGFCVVRGPDLLWGGDVRRFHPPAGRFEGVIGGPPCQAFSRLRHLVEHNGHKMRYGNLIPEFCRVVSEAGPSWFLMENVPCAPTPQVDGFGIHRIMLNNRWFGAEQHRERAFWLGTLWGQSLNLAPFIEFAALETPGWSHAVVRDARAVPVALGKGGKPKSTSNGARVRGETTAQSMPLEMMCELQGLPKDFTAEMPFTVQGKRSVIGNGVPLPMGRAVARAVKRALEGR